jgi:multiple sugar transport system permease protein
MWFIVSTSFKNDQQAYSVPPMFIFTPTFDNYINAFTTRGMMVNFTNSLIIGVISSVIAMLLGVPAAYALSRYKFKHKEGVFNWFLSTRMAPPILAGISFYMLSKQFVIGRTSLYDTKFLLIVVYVLINLSWVIWMMRSFFNDVPVEIDEAAMVDGCNRPLAFFRTVLPLAKPGLAATMIFCLIMAWNEYFFALILSSVKSKTLPAALTSFLSVHGLFLGQMCAAGTVVMMPILIFSIFMQKQLVRGLTMGAVKG